MTQKAVKMASLNLWRYNDWDTRLPKIIELVRKIDPDILFLQEVDKDPSKDDADQAEIINRKLGFEYKHFSKAETMTTSKGLQLTPPVDYGLGVLSKIPFQAETIFLSQASDDKHPRIMLVCKFKIDGIERTITNLHFSNRDDWAEAHFREALGILKSRGLRSVLAGDFNIKSMSGYFDIYKSDYTASSDFYDYVSYPKDGLSYDYMLLPQGVKFESFECREERVSDHRMIACEISFS